MLYGAGSLAFCTTELATNGSLRGEELIHPGCIAEFELSADSNFAEARCLTDGIRQVAASDITEETYTLSVSTEFNDWTSLQLAYDELAQTSSSVALPLVKSATVPTGLVITDTDVTALTAGSVKAYVSTRGTWGNRLYLKVVGVAPAAIDEVQVDGTTGELTFFTGLEGAVVTYVVDKAYTSVESIGVESVADQFGVLQFSGLVYGTEFPGQMLIKIPSIKRSTVPTLTINGDTATLEVEYRAQVLPGKRKPYELYDLSTAVV